MSNVANWASIGVMGMNAFRAASIGAILWNGAVNAQQLGKPEEVETRRIPQASPAFVEPEATTYADEDTQPTKIPLWRRIFGQRPAPVETMVDDQPTTMWGRFRRLMNWDKPEDTRKLMVVGSERVTDRFSNPDFQAAEDLFRREEYSAAQKAFKRLKKAYKNKPLEEDILFMLAESEFKLDRLPAAQDTYHQLLVKYPTTRYMPQAVQRSYDIAYFWMEDSRLRAEGKEGKYGFSRYVNLFDRTRPAFDTNGRAIETVEVIQQYDPFGPLTDDAVMMAAGHNFVNEDYVRSAGYYEQLVTDQPQSEHAGKAKILCEQSYLRAYRGPQYDSQDLEGARRMAQIALDSRENYSPDQQQRLEADLRAIHIERAKRDFTTGEDFRMRRYFTSAKYYYGLVVKNFPDTDWARRAEDRLRELGDKETVHFEVTKWFKNPFSRAAAPISNVFSDADSGSMPDSAVSESPQPAGQESSKPAEASPSEKKSLFNLRNWFDQL